MTGTTLASLKSERGGRRGCCKLGGCSCQGSLPSHTSLPAGLETRPRSAETQVEEDQRGAGEAARHAWGKAPRPPNRLEPQCSRAGSWDLICPEDGVCFHERAHSKLNVDIHTDAAGLRPARSGGRCFIRRKSASGSAARTAVTWGWGHRGGTLRLGTKVHGALSFPCGWRRHPFPCPALFTPLGRAHRCLCGHIKEKGGFTRLRPGGAPTHGHGHQVLFVQAPITMGLNVITGGKTDARSLALRWA